MVCPICHGTRLAPGANPPRPCAGCHGMGEIHCCDGLVVQPGYEEESVSIRPPTSPRPDPRHEGVDP